MLFVGAPPPDRRILRLIGSGGMGVVYEALDERLDRRVALKMLHPHVTVQAEMRDRLLKEARLAARVEHENVVRIYNVHEVDSGLCLEMQYVDGVPVSQLIAGQPLSLPRALDLLQQALEALAACHKKDVVHADLKPANLLVTREGKVLLADFGIARAVFSEGDAGIVTLSGPVWGTPQYCPPEAWRGASPNARWDLYALGVLMHEALCGSLPFAARTPAALMREKLDGASISLSARQSDLSAGLAGLIDSFTFDAAESRPESADAALKSLRLLPEFATSVATTKPLKHEEIAAGPSMPLPITDISPLPAHQSRGSRPSWVWGVIIAVAVLLGLGSFYAGRAAGIAPVAPDLLPPIAAEGEVGEVLHMAAALNYVVFSYDDGKHGRELWKADESGNVGMVKDLVPGTGSSNPHGILSRPSDGFMFSATTKEEGAEPWFFRGNPDEIRIIADLVTGPMSSDPEPVAAWKDLWYFYANPLTRNPGMWMSNSHGKTTGLLREFNPAAICFDDTYAPEFFEEAGITKVWNAGDRIQLMRFQFSDGSIESLGTLNDTIGDLAVLGDRFIFTMRGPDCGFELWGTDRNSKEPRLLKDIFPGKESGDPVDFRIWNGEVYFRAKTPEHGIELWKSNGTPEGTVEVLETNSGTQDGSPSNFVGTPDRIFFRASSETHGVELWSSSGVPGSAPTAYDIRLGKASSTPYSLAQIGNFLCFSADDGERGEEFWALDLSDPENKPYRVKDLRPGPDSSEPHTLTRLRPNTGIFVYKTGQGDALMGVSANGGVIELTEYDPLPLKR